MKIGVFTLGGPLEGKTMIILDKYSFVDGVMKVSYTDALLMRAILCGHYGCELDFENVASDEVEDAGEGSLAVSTTKPGMTEGEKVKAQATASALQAAERAAQTKAP